MTPPDLPDSGKDDGEWGNALRFPPWRQVAPDTFHNGQFNGQTLNNARPHDKGDNK